MKVLVRKVEQSHSSCDQRQLVAITFPAGVSRTNINEIEPNFQANVAELIRFQIHSERIGSRFDLNLSRSVKYRLHVEGVGSGFDSRLKESG